VSPTDDRGASLAEDLDRIAAAAESFAAVGERVAGILAAEPLDRGRVYLCAYEAGDERTWLALDGDGAPVADRHTVREAAQLAGLCEVAEESAGGGDVDDLIARLAEIRAHEAPPGIEEAEAAARALAAALEPGPRLATTAYLDRLGGASRRLEQALGDNTGSPFAAAMQAALPAIEELAAEVERTYKGPLA
jgi:hypothetical protein